VQIYLITPAAPADGFAERFESAMATGRVSAVLVRAGDMDADVYAQHAGQLARIAQQHEAALLLDDRPDLVRALGADGTHMTGGKAGFGEAVDSLKPEFIVGAGDITSRHEAMLRGEAGADYLMFGAPDMAPTPDAIELADWWAEMFEVPCVLCDTVSPPDDIRVSDCEFVALGENVWNAEGGPERALDILGERLEA